MKEIIMEVVASGIYNLADVLRKIDTLWFQSSLTDDDRKELIQLAQENANPEYGNKPFQDQLNSILERVLNLENTVSSLCAAVKLIGGTVQGTEDIEEWPAWYQWDGVGKSPWQKNTKCTHNEKRWVSQVNDNIWEPGGLGVHPNIWKESKE